MDIGYKNSATIIHPSGVIAVGLVEGSVGGKGVDHLTRRYRCKQKCTASVLLLQLEAIKGFLRTGVEPVTLG
jgi:hypothetical protein